MQDINISNKQHFPIKSVEETKENAFQWNKGCWVKERKTYRAIKFLTSISWFGGVFKTGAHFFSSSQSI